MPHEPLEPFAAYAGARRPKMLLLAEAWGADEENYSRPMVGASGRMLYQLLGEVVADEPLLYAEGLRQLYGLGFARARDRWFEAVGIGLTNVLNFRPRDNKLENVSIGKRDLPKGYGLAPFMKQQQTAKYLDPQYHGELDRLRIEVESASPNIVAALGATALWACLSQLNIGAQRGVVGMSDGKRFGSRKFIATNHPAAALYSFDKRPIIKQDLYKAWRESATPQLRRAERHVIINPRLEDIREWLQRLETQPTALLACDIETKARQITCIGFARSRYDALVVPFWKSGASQSNFWPSVEEECEAWKLTSRLLGTSVPKLFQNGMYDLQYLWAAGLRPRAVMEDTMLMHHSMFPELPKGLGFLASIYYSDEAAWKLMRQRGVEEQKADA